MTLSLDDVRNKRFRLARKSGYEVAEVDDFLDQLQESFAQLIEENETLKKQLDTVGDGVPAPAAVSDTAPREPAAPAAPETVVVTTTQEASSAVVRLVQLSTEQADRLVAEAKAEAERIQSEADTAASQLSNDSHAEAERLRAEAREHAERVRAEADARVQQLDAETAQRRQELFGDLDAERALLSSAVQDLRHFEEAFRSNLSEHLKRHLTVLEAGGAEPSDVPELAPAPGAPVAATPPADETPAPVADHDEAGEGEEEIETDPDATVQVSDTPRLDALLGDQR